MPVSEKRKPAPFVKAEGFLSGDHRKALLDKLDSENPDWVHAYESASILTGVKADEFLQTGREVVRGENGEPLKHKGDPVVRMRRPEEISRREAEEGYSEEVLKAHVKNKKPTVYRSPKGQA
jgi:hypothetical protein